jgi:type IV fimbrial biogenesis protein FimT
MRRANTLASGPPRAGGFTLLELLMTVAVLAVLVGVAIPGMAELVRNNRVTAQTNELVTTLNLARTEAIKRGRRVRVDVTQTATGWTATVTVIGVGGDPLRVVDRAASAVTVSTASVTFTPTGVPLTTPSFQLQPHSNCSGNQRRLVAIAVSGQLITTRQACA